MTGKVSVVKPRGVLVKADAPFESLEVGTRFEVYRVVEGVEVVIGTGVSRKVNPPDVFKVNPAEGEAFGVPQVGDLVRSV